MPCLALCRLALLACTFPGLALAAAPTGVDFCVAFLRAYEQCAASPGIPAVARTTLQQSITGMATSFRDSAACSARARRTVAAQCLQSPNAVRQSVVQAYKCDFPAALIGLSDNNNALLAALDAATPKPDSDCGSYSRYVDAMIGKGRDLARDIRANSNPVNTPRSFVSACNSAVDKLNGCEQSLPDK